MTNPERLKWLAVVPEGLMPRSRLLVQPIYLLLLSITTLTACTKTLDPNLLETEIRDTIIRQGGISLKTVACPQNVPLETGKTFECIGELDSGDTFVIPAKQIEAGGKVEWDVPHTKGLLNLVKLQTLVQEAIRAEGQTLAIDCGQGYRAVKSGESFECSVKQPDRKKASPTSAPTVATSAVKPGGKPKTATLAKSPTTILVTIDPERNVNWQQVITTVTEQATAIAPVRAVTTATTAAPPPNPVNRGRLSAETQKDLEERFD